MSSRFLRSLVCVVLLLVAVPSWAADDEISVAFVSSLGGEPVGERLRAELTALGFRTVRVDGEDPRLALEGIARRAGAAAAIRIISVAGSVELWIADRATGQTLLRQVVSADGAPPLAPADVALMVVELLRASLLESSIASPRAAALSSPPRPRELAERAETGPAAASVDLGAGVLASAGGIPASAQLQLAFQARLTSRLAARLLASVPLDSPRISAVEGSATIKTAFFGAGIDVLLSGTGSRWRSFAGVGLGAWWLHMQGTGASSLVGLGADAVTAAPYCRLDVSLRLTGRIDLLADALVGYAVAQPRLRFVDRTVAVFGRPAASTTLSLRVSWP